MGLFYFEGEAGGFFSGDTRVCGFRFVGRLSGFFYFLGCSFVYGCFLFFGFLFSGFVVSVVFCGIVFGKFMICLL